MQPSGNNDKTSLGKVLFPPRNYRTEAPVEVLDTPFHAHRKTSAKQFLANYSINSRHFWQGFFFFFPSFSSLNLELLKSSQTVEVDKEQKQTKNPNKPQTTAGETIRDKAEYSVQWEIIRADSRIFFFFFSFKTRKRKKRTTTKSIYPKPYFWNTHHQLQTKPGSQSSPTNIYRHDK